jgi:hypothetical protein
LEKAKKFDKRQNYLVKQSCFSRAKRKEFAMEKVEKNLRWRMLIVRVNSRGKSHKKIRVKAKLPYYFENYSNNS